MICLATLPASTLGGNDNDMLYPKIMGFNQWKQKRGYDTNLCGIVFFIIIPIIIVIIITFIIWRLLFQLSLDIGSYHGGSHGKWTIYRWFTELKNGDFPLQTVSHNQMVYPIIFPLYIPLNPNKP